MAKILFEPFDIIKFDANDVIGMILPCGKVITFEGNSKNITHCVNPAPNPDNITLVKDKDLTSEMRIAFTFARLAFKIEGANSK